MSLAPPDGEHELLDLAIRFSASLPDMLLSVPNPATSATPVLKQLIRSHLPPDLANRRIRLIYAGKSLADSALLSSSLRLPSSRSPSRPSTPLPDRPRSISSSYHHPQPPPRQSSPAKKGKAAIRDPPSLSRIYVHCSIGDIVLSAQDLAEEARLAKKKDGDPVTQDNATAAAAAAATAPPTSTTPAPRGFDRLLNAGFSHTEIQSLRTEFVAIQAHTHLPTDMPSPNTLREMEDRWLDNSNAGGGDVGGGNGGNGGGGGDGGSGYVDDDAQAGALDDMLWGTIMGFFWPVGCLWWLCREEGVWSRRRKVAVVIGVVVNAGFGGIRWLK